MTAELLAHWNDFDNETQVRVEPDVEGKAVRIVSFVRDGNDIEITCVDAETLVLCPANKHGLFCSHSHRAIEALLETLKD